MATYTKLNDGTWGVRAEGVVTAGEQITVTKRDGSRKTETVAQVLWTGIAKDGRQASLVTLVARAARPSGYGRGKDYWIARRSYERTGDYYGSGLYDEES